MDLTQRNLFEGCIEVVPGTEPSQTVNQLPHCKGVVLFADKSDVPILLLIAADIKRLALNRLTLADTTVATKRVKLAEIVGKIYYLCCWCDFNSTLQHYRIAKELFPSRYTDFVTLSKIWDIKINLTAKWPYFSITENPKANDDIRVFGPFPSRRAAGDYINSLNEAFALCRQQCLIDDPEKAVSCPYYQMHVCGAPCTGKTSRQDYMQQIEDAVQAAGGRRKELEKTLQEKMRAFSAKMDFEQAQIVKKQLEYFKQLEDNDYKWVCDIRQLKLLHIDKGPKIKIKGQKRKSQSFMALMVRAGSIGQLNDFTIEQIPKLFENIKSENPDFAFQISDSSELMSLAGFALYRSKHPGLWIDCRKEISSGEILNLLDQAFSQAQDSQDNEILS